jgi:dihydropyrimidinase
MTRRVVIRGGLVVTPAGILPTDVVVAGERVDGLGPRNERGGEVFDAAGCYVLPGGVDPHTHLLADVASATRSAAFGGTTTAVCFTNPRPGESDADAVIRGRGEVERLADIDVALHAIIGEPDRFTTRHMEQVRAQGARALKLFLAFPDQGLMASDGCLYEVLREATRLGLLVRVHCENGSVIQALVGEYLARGRQQPAYFARSRPPEVEEEAIARTLAIARLANAAVYITHISTAGGIRLVQAARANGQVVLAEVCLHHLLLDANLSRGKRAERFLVAPPLRAQEHLDALWPALANGTVDTLGSDHSQLRYQPPAKDPADFTTLAYGFAGIELRLPLMLSEGLRRGLPIERIAELTATRPAQVFGLFPRKGAIMPGADADLVVWDPRPEWRVRPSALHDGLGNSVYAGMKVRGAIRFVFLRGELIVANGNFVGPDSTGRCLSAHALASRSGPLRRLTTSRAEGPGTPAVAGKLRRPSIPHRS